MRLTADTYSAPPRNATPTGSRSPDAIFRTLACKPCPSGATALTSPFTEPTNNVPCAPNAISRAPGTRATTSIVKPGGRRMRSSGSGCADATDGRHAAASRSNGAMRENMKPSFAGVDDRSVPVGCRRAAIGSVGPSPRGAILPLCVGEIMNAPEPARHLNPPTPRPEDLAGYEMIRRLVAYPTVSRDSNLELIEWVRRYLEALGASTARTFDDDRRKANLFATLP